MMTIDEIFADDCRNPPAERSLPWKETCGGVAVVVEPKPHWAVDMRVSGRPTGLIATTPTGPQTVRRRGSAACGDVASATRGREGLGRM